MGSFRLNIYCLLFINFLLYSVSWNMSGKECLFHKQTKINRSYRRKKLIKVLMFLSFTRYNRKEKGKGNKKRLSACTWDFTGKYFTVTN